MLQRVRKLRVGDGLDPGTDVGPLINEASIKKVMEYVEIGRNEGAKLLVGGKRLDSRRVREGLVPRADDFLGLHAEDAHLPGGNFRAGGERDADRWI